MQILHTVPYTFPKVLMRRICFKIQSFSGWWSFPLFSWPWCVIQGWYCEEKLDASHSYVAKGVPEKSSFHLAASKQQEHFNMASNPPS